MSSNQLVLRPQEGPQHQFVNLMDDIPLVFYGGEHCAPLAGNR